MQTHTIQIIDHNNLPVGAAFLVGDDLLLTCAHVVRAAGSAAGQVVSLRTPSGTELSAMVEAWRDENAEDVASLRLAAPLDEMQHLPLGASSGSQGHRFSTYGFPQPGQALSGNGTITGYATLNGIQYLQLESSQVTPGFSGAPVFDEVTKRVVGMVVAIAPPDEYQRQGTTAFAVPTETLREIIPALQLSELCPYRSLDAFTEADAELFFGRERVVAKLLESLNRNSRFLAVLGPSGSGKSSVVGAGLIPALRKGQLLGSEKWGILSIRPGTQPFEQLASAGMSDPANLVKSASDWLAAHPQNERLLILIDQFEELLVSTPSDIRAEFVAALADLLNSPLDVTVLLTLRDDFYSRFVQDAEPLVGLLAASQYIIPPTLEETELREIVERPARDLGLVFAQGLVDAILADARTADPSGRAIRSTVLPLLEFALTQLWERRVDGELTHAEYRARGGVTGGLSQWADRAYYRLNEAQRAIARRVFSELVTLGDETQGIADTRRVRSIAELTAKDGEATKTVLDALVAARLLVARHDDVSGQDTVEIIHETLLREWALLEGWLQDDRQFLLWREGLRASQQAWQESGQDVGALLRGAPLAEAEDWLEKRGGDLGNAEKEYISKSVALRVRGERNRRWVMAGLALVAVLMAGLAFWGSSSATEARDQAATAEAASTLVVLEYNRAEQQTEETVYQETLSTINQLIANSRSASETSPATGLLLAVEAYILNKRSGRISDETAIKQAILDALGNVGGGTPLKDTENNDFNRISPDSKWLISASKWEAKPVRIWNLASFEASSPEILTGNMVVAALAFSPNGQWLALGNYRGNIWLWNLFDNDFLHAPSVLEGHGEEISTITFSPNGNWLATSSVDSTVNLWEYSSDGFHLVESISVECEADVLEFSPGSNWLFIAQSQNRFCYDTEKKLNFVKPRVYDLTKRETVFVSGEKITTENFTVSDLAYSNDDNWLAFLETNKLRIVDLRSMEHYFLNEEEEDVEIQKVEFGLNDQYLLIDIEYPDYYNNSRYLRFFPIVNGQIQPVYTRQIQGKFVGLLEKENLLVTEYNGTISLWGESQLFLNEDSEIFANSDYSSIIATGSIVAQHTTDEIYLWHVKQQRDRTILSQLKIDDSRIFRYFEISPDGQYVISRTARALGKNLPVRIWDLSKINHQVVPIVLSKKQGEVSVLRFSLDGKKLVAGWDDGKVQLWDISSFPIDRLSSYQQSTGINDIKFLSDNLGYKTVNQDGVVTTYSTTVQISQRKYIPSFGKGENFTCGYKFSANGQWLLYKCNRNSNIWDLSTLEPNPILATQQDRVAKISPDSQWFISASEDEINLIKLDDEQMSTPIVIKDYRFSIDDVAISPDSKLLAVCGENQPLLIKLLGKPNQLKFVQLSDYSPNLSCTLKFSNDSNWLAVDYGAGSYTYELWDLSKGVLNSKRYLVYKIDPTYSSYQLPLYSQDNNLMIGGGYDGKIRLWDISNNNSFQNPLILKISPYEGFGQLDLDISPNNNWVVADNENGEISLWPINLDFLVSLSCEQVGRNLSLIEWQTYFRDEPYEITCPQWPVDEDALTAMDN